jgi:hypothetical protein
MLLLINLQQCINRIHRIGQQAEVVRVRKFVVEDSVEEKIVKLQMKKKVSLTKLKYMCVRKQNTNLELPSLDKRIWQPTFWIRMEVDNWKARNLLWMTSS